MPGSSRSQRRNYTSFTKRLIELRHGRTPRSGETQFLEWCGVAGEDLPDAWWFRPDGYKMTQKDWSGGEPVLGLFLNGDELPNRNREGEPITRRLVPVDVQRLR